MSNDNLKESAEIKLLKLKLSLYEEIATSKRQIQYSVTNGAKTLEATIRSKLKSGWVDTIEFTKEEYQSMLSYFEAVNQNQMHRLDKYLESYYTEIATKEKILNQL